MSPYLHSHSLRLVHARDVKSAHTHKKQKKSRKFLRELERAKESTRAKRRYQLPLLFADVEETEVPTKDAVRMVKPNMFAELYSLSFF